MASLQRFTIDLTRFAGLKTAATQTVFTGPKDATNSFASPQTVVPKAAAYKAAKRFTYTAMPYSLTVIWVRGKG